MKYKGYSATITVDEDESIMRGEVTGTRDVITFQDVSAQEALQAFRDSVDDYLAFCAERGDKPEQPLTGAQRFK